MIVVPMKIIALNNTDVWKSPQGSQACQTLPFTPKTKYQRSWDTMRSYQVGSDSQKLRYHIGKYRYRAVGVLWR